MLRVEGFSGYFRNEWARERRELAATKELGLMLPGSGLTPAASLASRYAGTLTQVRFANLGI